MKTEEAFELLAKRVMEHEKVLIHVCKVSHRNLEVLTHVTNALKTAIDTHVSRQQDKTIKNIIALLEDNIKTVRDWEKELDQQKELDNSIDSKERFEDLEIGDDNRS